MANPLNPKFVSWQHSGKNTDGSAFTSSQYVGSELSIDGAASVSIPVAFATNGQYQFDLTTLAGWAALANGTHTAAVRVAGLANKSALSPAGSFDIDRRTPEAPFGVTFA